jgi:hypothetical protein
MKKKLLLIIVLFHSLLQSQTFNGNLGSQSLNWNMDQKDFNTIPRDGIAPMSIKLWDNYNGVNAPSQYGTLLEINGRVSHLDSQLYFTGSWDNGRILYRSAFYAQTAWQDWRYLLDSKSDIESSGNLKIQGNSNSYILNGNVGIGTTNPTSKLTVAGNINSREVKVTVDAGADFVFEKNYDLPSLDAVDKFIKENKHLPEIASADEMKKDGINLSEMNIKLLQKIEEMTLYMIEQNKKIIDLENRLKKVENN